jgi:transcriptional regulator with XRE-family HTH domain
VAGKMVSGQVLLGGLLREYRSAANLTQEELAERAGLSVQAISMLERGARRTPRTNTVEALSDALRLDASQREMLVAAARGKPEPGALLGHVAGHAAEPLARGSDAAAPSAPLARRWLPSRWWPVPALQGGLLAAMFLIVFTGGGGWLWRPGPSPAPSSSSLSLPRCTTADHPRSCWATVTYAGIDQGGPCHDQVPLYVRGGGQVCLARGELVEISCYYSGRPSVDGDKFQEHVVEEDSGRLEYVGHIPDRFVDLGNNHPSAVAIARC